jgi:Flp pilus assembly protein TadD
MATETRFEQWVSEGEAAYAGGDLVTARTCFEEAYWEADGPSPQVAAWLGKLDLREGNLEAAAYWVYETLSAAPGDPDALDELARVAVDCLSASVSLEWARRFAFARPDHPASGRLVSLIKDHRDWVRSTLSKSKRLRRSNGHQAAEELLVVALARAPGEVRFLNERGQVAFELGDLGTARRHFLAAHRLSPTDPYGTNNLAKTYAREHRHKAAQRWYQKTLEHHPDDVYALVGLGQMELRRHGYAQARQWFESALERAPEDALAKQGLARARRGDRVLQVVREAKALRRRKEYAKAERVLLRAAAQLDNPVQIVVELGLVAHGAGRYDDARNLFVLAYQDEPWNVLVLNMLGALEVAGRQPTAGQFDAARKWYLLALARSPKETRTLNSLGWLALRQRRFGEALECFDRVLKQQPENPKALRGKGEVAMRRGDYEEAQQWWDQSWWSNEQDDPILMTSMARSSIAQGDFETARALLESALEKAPSDLYILTSLAYLAIVQDRLDEAERRLEAACALGAPDARVLNLLGKLSQKRGQFASARRCYAATLGEDPENTYALAGLGWTAYESGMMDEAEHWFGKVLELDETNPYALTGMGVTKARLGEFQEAQKCYQTSLQERFHPPAVWHWFRLATLSGNAQQLRWFLEEAHEKGGFEQWISGEILFWQERVHKLMGLVREGADPWPYVNDLATQLPRCYHA